MTYAEPKFALIEVEGGYIVEQFDKGKHISKFGWAYPDVTLFVTPSEVAHLRDQILN